MDRITAHCPDCGAPMQCLHTADHLEMRTPLFSMVQSCECELSDQQCLDALRVAVFEKPRQEEVP